jgi:hypothetical protein
VTRDVRRSAFGAISSVMPIAPANSSIPRRTSGGSHHRFDSIDVTLGVYDDRDVAIVRPVAPVTEFFCRRDCDVDHRTSNAFGECRNVGTLLPRMVKKDATP